MNNKQGKTFSYAKGKNPKEKLFSSWLFPAGSPGQESSVGWVWVAVQAAAWGAELGGEGTTSPSQEPVCGMPLIPIIFPCSIWELGGITAVLSHWEACKEGMCSCCRAVAVSWHCPALAKSHVLPHSLCDTAIYFSISRKRETRRVFLTPRLNLQFYYIPVMTGQPNTLAVTVSLGLGSSGRCRQLPATDGVFGERAGGFTGIHIR